MVSLKDIVEHLDMQMDEVTHYLDKRTHEIVTVTDEEISELEWSDPDDLPQWLRDAAPRIKEILESDHYLALPLSFDVHEWDIMRRFAESHDSRDVGRQLLDAIHGPGAFRMFKATIERLGIRDDWFAFREKALEEIAREWLEAEGIEYE